jgi:hypothetical protein
MIVKFQNTFHVPGFGRRRFQKGVIQDVPNILRGKLPKSAVILENYVPEDQKMAAEEERRAADYARAATDTSTDTLEKVGLAGFAGENSTPADEVGSFVVQDGKLVAAEAAEGVKSPSRKAKK